MNNKLCRDAARGNPVALEAYKAYAIVSTLPNITTETHRLIVVQQDYFYLIDLVKFMALRLATVPQYDLDTLNTELDSVSKSFSWVTDWAKTCVTDLHIDPNQLVNTERSIAEMAYAGVLQNNTRVEDWFNLHVIMIGCIYVSSVL